MSNFYQENLATMSAIDCEPVDMVADILVELILAYSRAMDHSKIDRTLRLLQIVTRKHCQWEDTLSTVRQQLGSHFPAVPIGEWASKLQDGDG